MMLIAECLFYLFMEVLLYGLGRMMVPLVSFGRARAVRGKELFSTEFRAYDEDGKMLVPEFAARLLGIVTLVAVAVLINLFWRA
jgi:hypothetical protein